MENGPENCDSTFYKLSKYIQMSILIYSFGPEKRKKLAKIGLQVQKLKTLYVLVNLINVKNMIEFIEYLHSWK